MKKKKLWLPKKLLQREKECLALDPVDGAKLVLNSQKQRTTLTTVISNWIQESLCKCTESPGALTSFFKLPDVFDLMR